MTTAIKHGHQIENILNFLTKNTYISDWMVTEIIHCDFNSLLNLLLHYSILDY